MSAIPSRPLRALCLVLLALAVLLAFLPALQGAWIQFDDPVYVLENPHIRGGFRWENVRWVLGSIHGGNWHPLTSFSHMLDVELFGLDPRGPHAENLLLHATSTLMLAWLLFRTTGAWWASLLCAALFGLHPLRVESVAWISERKDVLSMLLGLLALLAWLRWTERPSAARYGLALGAFVLGLLAKPMLVTLPCLLLLLDHWPLARSRSAGGELGWKQLLLEKWPFFAASAAFSAITFLVQSTAGAVSSMERIAPALRVQNALLSVGRYLWATLWPAELSVYYPYITPRSAWPALVLGIVLAVSILLAWRLRARAPAVLVGWLWFLGTLMPVIGLVQVGGQSHADRYTYLPGIGLSIALVFGTRPWGARNPVALRVLSCVLAAACLPLLLATRAQAALWKDTRTLFGHALEVTSQNALAHQVYGNALLVDGEVAPAIEHLREALRLSPDFPDAHNNLGSALGSQGDYEGAVREFRAALRTQETAESRHNLGFALSRLGRTDEAIPEFQRALELDPRHAPSHAKLGVALGAKGRLAEAEEHLTASLELLPNDPETRRWQAMTLTLQGKVEEGIAAYRKLLELLPDDPDALNNIAWIRATHADPGHRDGAEAVRLAERARDKTPQENAVLLSTLAAAYAEAGRFEEAVRSATRAVELARAQQDGGAVQRYEGQLECYRAGRAFRLP
jgi:tetratricopeptide (TPR) repeat protein